MARMADAEEMTLQQREAAIELAYRRGNLDEVYRLTLPVAEGGDRTFQYALSGTLLYADWAPIAGLSAADRRQLGLMWLRRAADGGEQLALAELSNSYRLGLIDLGKDSELAECFRKAVEDRSLTAACRKMEVAKGYARER